MTFIHVLNTYFNPVFNFAPQQRVAELIKKAHLGVKTMHDKTSLRRAELDAEVGFKFISWLTCTMCRFHINLKWNVLLVLEMGCSSKHTHNQFKIHLYSAIKTVGQQRHSIWSYVRKLVSYVEGSLWCDTGPLL